MLTNTKQIKQQDIGPPNQTTDEEIRNLPEKEFRIMISENDQKP